MSTAKNSRYILPLIILLTIINVVAVFTVFSRVRQSEREVVDKQDTTAQLPPGRRHFPQMLRDEVGFDDEQLDQVWESRRDQREKMEPVFRELGNLNEQLVLEVMKQEPDTLKINRLCSEIGNYHAELKHLMVYHMRDVWHIAEPEQRARLTTFYLDMLKGDPSVSGRGGDHRHRRGRRFNNKVTND